MNYGRTVGKALYWAGISSDEWYDMAEVKGIWNKVTHGEWNGTAGIDVDVIRNLLRLDSGTATAVPTSTG